MRIASLLPAATEWVAVMDALDQLVGRSHECDFPPSVTSLPVLTAPTYPDETGSRAIHEAVQRRVQEGLSLYDVDLDRLADLQPDVVLTQAQCEVCAASLSDIEGALHRYMNDRGEAPPELFSMQPDTFKAVLDTALRMGRRLGRAESIMRWIAAREKALRALHEAIGLERRTDPASLPTVACIEWMDPLMAAGHWTPDVVAQGGGHALLAEPGDASRTITWQALADADPDVLFVMPCGFTLSETARDWDALAAHPVWPTLRAVQADRVFVFDGNAYFNRPGPRLYRAVELVAEALYPENDRAGAAPARPNEMQRGRPSAAGTPA